MLATTCGLMGIVASGCHINSFHSFIGKSDSGGVDFSRVVAIQATETRKEGQPSSVVTHTTRPLSTS